MTPDVRSRRSEALEIEARNKHERYFTTSTRLRVFDATSLAYPSLARTEGEASSVTKTFWGAIMVHDEGERYPKHSTGLRFDRVSRHSILCDGGGTAVQTSSKPNGNIGSACAAMLSTWFPIIRNDGLPSQEQSEDEAATYAT